MISAVHFGKLIQRSRKVLETFCLEENGCHFKQTKMYNIKDLIELHILTELVGITNNYDFCNSNLRTGSIIICNIV